MSYSKAKVGLGQAVHRASRFAFWLIAATALVLSTACTTHQAVAPKASVDPEWWLGPLDDAMDHYIDAVAKSCPIQGFLSNEKCVKAKIVESFGQLNGAGTHCQADDTWGNVLLCPDLLTATERIYRVLGVDPQSAMDWDDPYDSAASVSQLLATRLTSKCPDTAQGDCVAREMAAMLAVDPHDAGRCVLTSEIKRQVSCAMGLIRIEQYRSALLYAE